jgi:hypothetical protein
MDNATENTYYNSAYPQSPQEIEEYKRTWLMEAKAHFPEDYKVKMKRLAPGLLDSPTISKEVLNRLRLINVNLCLLFLEGIQTLIVVEDSFEEIGDLLASWLPDSDIKKIGLARDVHDVDPLEGCIFDQCLDGECLLANFVLREGYDDWTFALGVPQKYSTEAQKIKLKRRFKPGVLCRKGCTILPPHRAVLTSVCHTCQKPTDKYCAGCQKVWYCEAKCQKKDRKNHKQACRQTAKKPDTPKPLAQLEALLQKMENSS